MRISEAAQGYLDYLAERNKAQLTSQTYRYTIQRFLDYIGGIRGLSQVDLIEAITQDDIRQFSLYLYRQGLAPATRVKYLVVLRNWFKYLLRLGATEISPELIELPKLPPRVPNPDERLAVMLSIDPESQDEWRRVIRLRDKAILQTLFSTQLRVSELTSLNRNSIDWQRGLAVVVGKGRRPRTVFFSTSSIEAIDAYLDARTDQYLPLFIHHDRAHKVDLRDREGHKMRLTRQSVESMVKKYARLAGVQATPHSFRHYGATELLKNGADIRSVQELLGHVSVSTTQVYTHVSPRRLQQEWQRYHPAVDPESKPS
ncbi:MAG: xerD [Dehalococcoidia bacterium]|nr:xerD [Dehalococcoidia bacterium]